MTPALVLPSRPPVFVRRTGARRSAVPTARRTPHDALLGVGADSVLLPYRAGRGARRRPSRLVVGGPLSGSGSVGGVRSPRSWPRGGGGCSRGRGLPGRSGLPWLRRRGR